MNSKGSLPIFPKIIAILALLASIFRVYVGVSLILILLDGVRSSIPIGFSWAEAITALLAGCFGVSGSAGLLKKQRELINRCWLNIVFNMSNIIIAFIGFQLLPYAVPFFDDIGLGIIRVVFTIIYAIAIIKASRWFQMHDLKDSSNTESSSTNHNETDKMANKVQ
jgi:hypothetical protein